MEYAKIENGRITKIATIEILAPNTSFTDGIPNDAFLAEHGLMSLEPTPVVDSARQRVEWAEASIVGSRVRTWRVVDLTADEIAYQQDYATQTAWQAIRNQRDRILKDTDWTQLSDAPVDRAAWATYRQALRDITQQSDPRAITWPTQP
jgi:hypothetical protein